MTTRPILAAISRVRNATIAELHAIVNVTNRAFLSDQFLVTGDRTDASDILRRFATGVPQGAGCRGHVVTRKPLIAQPHR